MKKIIVVFIVLLIFLPAFSSIKVRAEDDQNISITELIYNPNPPIRDKYVYFVVNVSIEVFGKGGGFAATGFVDGEQIQIFVNGEWYYLVDEVLCDRPYYKLFYPVLWPNDNKPHKVEFVVDYKDRLEETNEEDNTKSITLTGTTEPDEPPEDPPDDPPDDPPGRTTFLEKIILFFNQLFQKINNLFG